MLGIVGFIGIGFFFGFGGVVFMGGFFGVLLGYVVIGLVVCFV